MTRKHRVVAGLMRGNGAILLCKRQVTREWYPGVWDLPGGHLAAGEDPRTALGRELSEELGVTAVISQDPWLEAGTDEADVTVFEILDWTGTIRNENSAEHAEVAWFTRDAMNVSDLGPLATYIFCSDRGAAV